MDQYPQQPLDSSSSTPSVPPGGYQPQPGNMGQQGYPPPAGAYPQAGALPPYPGQPGAPMFADGFGGYPPQPRAFAFQWGWIGAGVLAGIEVAWFVLWIFGVGRLLVPLFFNLFFSSFLLYGICYGFLFVGLPILGSLPVFFWISKQSAMRAGRAQAGTSAAFQAAGWWVIFKVLFLIFQVFLLQFSAFFRIGIFNFGIVYILDVLLMFGAAWWMGTVGGKAGSSQGPLPGSYLPPMPPVSGAGAPFGVSPQPAPASAPQSALEILQMRLARGEIDAATYKEMRVQLETPAPKSDGQQ